MWGVIGNCCSFWGYFQQKLKQAQACYINQFIEERFLFLLMFSTRTRTAALFILGNLCLLIALTTLTDAPSSWTGSLGRVRQQIETAPMFIEKTLSSLVNERKWIQVVKVSNSVLTNHGGYQGSFKFWYYRALGECALLQIQACARSHLEASLRADETYGSSIQKMGQFLQLFAPKPDIEGTYQQIDAGFL